MKALVAGILMAGRVRFKFCDYGYYFYQTNRNKLVYVSSVGQTSLLRRATQARVALVVSQIQKSFDREWK